MKKLLLYLKYFKKKIAHNKAKRQSVLNGESKVTKEEK
jgi:hypothetical protein